MDKNDFSDDQKTQLRQCESAIKKGTKAFLEMCEAFRTIKREELWRGSHKSFPAYVKEKWHMDGSTVSRYIKAAEVLEDLQDAEKKPTNEGQCRVLGKLTPDERRQVWGKVLESEKKPTGSLIAETAKEMGFMEKPEDEEEVPPKEQNVLSDFASTVGALSYLADSVSKLDSADEDQVREYVTQCRFLLEQIEKAIDGNQFTAAA